MERGRCGVKRTLLSLALCGALCLTGCSSLLDRPYVMVEPHVEQPVLSEDSSALQVGTYSELVNGVLFLVSQGETEGTIQLIDYRGEVEEDLSRACLEVATEDPLGAYAVDKITHSYARVLTTYEAAISISYRRTREQIQSISNISSTSAIRRAAAGALAEHRPELALRVSYFTGDANTVVNLIRQAYYDDPASAMGLPRYTVALYPEDGPGVQRVVEMVFSYPADPAELEVRKAQLQERVRDLVDPPGLQQYDETARQGLLFQLLSSAVRYDPEGGSTAWDALVGDGADSEGLALAFQLLAEELEVGSALVEGTLDGQSHFWNQLTADGGAHYVDLTRDTDGTTYSPQDLLALGYVWDGAPEI